MLSHIDPCNSLHTWKQGIHSPLPLWWPAVRIRNGLKLDKGLWEVMTTRGDRPSEEVVRVSHTFLHGWKAYQFFALGIFRLVGKNVLLFINYTPILSLISIHLFKQLGPFQMFCFQTQHFCSCKWI